MFAWMRDDGFCTDIISLPRCLARYFISALSIKFYIFSSEVFITLRHVMFACIV